ncbi:RNA polymerase sigma factor [Actinocatenispora comari]|uniref:RNA polymerase sigma-70 factor, ECF subfamily protein n=1 Tax=Actinocatenispora comari TaxID=2807577 RepID=A0A8J4EMW7_9ACTN|nr:DUF6596 domain-containing protein [Actinocatenispora comari]GIL29198.1 RNA polymerase sigma-70 factor, ECF subfamily protein [Actinocatenispora comari]GIL31847.1 RNA polymerase sigma-70 factor, ECF subfamily protein [Actinocatenispora comari]
MPDPSRAPDDPGNASTVALIRVFKQERAAILATLVRQLGDLTRAEDAVQDAFTTATRVWRQDGVPPNPGGWLTVTARRRAIDQLRRDRSRADRTARLAELMRLDTAEHPAVPHDVIDDDRLRLIFTCCHPALGTEARIALTLRVVAGLTTAEIASAFLVAEPTMGKRIVRAKRRLADARVRYRVPDRTALAGRLDGVLHVLYLIFNEGYSATPGDHLVRTVLCAEGLRLSRLLTELMPDQPETWGLLALMLLLDARRGARVDAAGRYVPWERQDRACWDDAAIAAGTTALRRALELRRPGRYQVEAAIAAELLQAGRTDWARIADLYGALARLAPSSVVALNRAAAVGLAAGPRAGLVLLEPLLADPALRQYQPLHATHADLLRRAGATGAAAAYQRAIALTVNPVQRDELQRRLDDLGR